MGRLAVIATLCAIACRTRNEARAPSPGTTNPFLGRWDVTASAAGETYPLWFELVERGGKLEGRFQGRDGQPAPMEAIELTQGQLSFQASQDSYTGSLGSDTGQGSGKKVDGSTLTWTASRAPELPAPPNPRWREPLELSNGKDLRGWKPRHGAAPNLWKSRGGALVNRGKGADLVGEPRFMDFRLRLEVNLPAGGESGIYLRGRYEVQLQDDYGKPLDSRSTGGIYGHLTPISNAARRAGEWQEVELTLLGRWVSVSLNGRTVIENQEIPGITEGALDSSEGEPGPLVLQGGRGAVAYRNIVIRPLLVDSETPR